MREIKYRAWDLERKEMFIPSMLSNHSQDGFFTCQRFQGDSPSKLMLFTGLYDIDGNEIYEGDIVEVFHTTNDLCDGDGFRTVGVVEYSPAEFYINGSGWCITCHFHYNNSDRKILGNIYETPELINQPLQ